MRRFLFLAALSLLGCGSPGSNLPVQEPAQVVALFVSTVRACTAGLTPEGGIDQAAMARSGWHVARRRLMFEGGTERELALNAYGPLRRTEYEASEWARDGVANRIVLGRWPVEPHRMHDQCDIDAQTQNRAAAEAVVAAMRARFGRPPDRIGGRPNGGDALTPGFGDIDSTIHYWALPRNDAYVSFTEDGYLRLEVLAMPDRAALDEYHPDNPETRIPIVAGSN
jgi:hypothetical protein